jgi:predicted transposase YdaD
MSESVKNNIHDKSYKDLFSNKETFLNLIQSFVSDTWGKKLNKDDLVLVNKSYILSDYEEQESDIVYTANLDGNDVYFYVLLEFQSSVDFRMPIRLLLYMIEIWRETLKNTTLNEFKRKAFRLPAIVPIVLYNGKKKWTAAKELKDVISNSDIFGNNILNFKYEFIDVNSYEKEELYNKKNISSAIFLLDQNINRIEFYHRLTDIIIGFNELSCEEKMQIKHWLININTEEKDFKDNIEKIFNADKGEVLNMTSNISKGLEKLKEDGKIEGKLEGKIEGKTEILIKLLSRKFKTLPKEYIEEIKTLPENIIENIATDIFDIESIEDLKKYF